MKVKTKRFLLILIPSIFLVIITGILTFLFIPRKPNIESSSVFEISNELSTLKCTVSNSQETFSFTDTLELPLTNSWRVFKDIDGTDEVKTNAVLLEPGNNTFYILVENNNNENKMYTVTIRRKPLYSVIFDKGEHYTENRYLEQIIEEGNLATQPTEQPSKDGYTFNGWNIDFEKVVESNITAIATYSENINKIYFLKEKNNLTNHNIIEAKTGESIALPNNTFSKEGYKFSSWILQRDNSSHGIGNKYTIGTESDIYFFAHWTPILYTATLNYNGGILSSSQINYTVESSTIQLPETSKENYNFEGWYSDLNDESTRIASIISGSAQNMTLYAKFTPIKYSINYHYLNDCINPNPLYTTVESESFTLKSPTHPSLIFQGWFLDSNYLTPVTEIEEGKTEEINFYAKWHSTLDGTLTEDNYIIIDTVGYYITVTQTTTLWSKDFILNSDLDFENRDISQIGNYKFGAFSGIFNGNGHSLINFNYTEDISSTRSYYSLFNLATEGKIEKLYIKGNDLIINASKNPTKSYYIGGIVSIGYGTISNCYCDTNISLTQNTTVCYVGGIIGQGTSSLNIEKCYSQGSLSTDTEYTMLGGIVGGTYKKISSACPEISYSFSMCNITKGGSIITYYNDYNASTLTNCYQCNDQVINGRLTEDNLTFEELLSALKTDWDSNIWNLYDDKLPTLIKK